MLASVFRTVGTKSVSSRVLFNGARFSTSTDLSNLEGVLKSPSLPQADVEKLDQVFSTWSGVSGDSAAAVQKLQAGLRADGAPSNITSKVDGILSEIKTKNTTTADLSDQLLDAFKDVPREEIEKNFSQARLSELSLIFTNSITSGKNLEALMDEAKAVDNGLPFDPEIDVEEALDHCIKTREAANEELRQQIRQFVSSQQSASSASLNQAILEAIEHKPREDDEEEEGEGDHHGEAGHDNPASINYWSWVSKVGGVVIAIYAAYWIYCGDEHVHREKDFPFMRIRNKEFPWGEKDLLNFSKDDEEHH